MSNHSLTSVSLPLFFHCISIKNPKGKTMDRHTHYLSRPSKAMQIDCLSERTTPCTQHPTTHFVIAHLCFHQTRAMIQIHRLSNTENRRASSTQIGDVCQTVVLYALPLIGSRTSWRHHGCRGFRNSWYILLPNISIRCNRTPDTLVLTTILLI